MSIWAFAVRRWQFTLVMFALLIALGLASFANIARSEDPSFPFPAADISVVWPGANPADMERLIVKPIEDAVNTLENVKKIQSSAFDGLAVVHTEFYYGGDPEKKQDEVIREFNRIRSSLPPDITQVDIRKDSPGLVSIVQMALVSDTASWRELKEKAENLKDSFESVPGVRTAEIWAFPNPEVRVAIDLQRLARVGVSLDQVIRTIQGQNQNVPGGSVDVGLRRYNLRTSGSYTSLEQIADTVVGAGGGREVRVRDIAEVSWQTEEQTYTGRFNGKRAVFVTANQKDNTNIFKVRDGIYARLAEFERTLPADIRLERGFDQSQNVSNRLGQLGEDFAIAIALVLLTLLPLGLRAAGVVMISIPLSLAIGVALLYVAGFGLNQLSIAGFVLALGLLVDDSIVVVENIARYVRQGYGRMEAAIAATDQIYLAVLGCTATLVLAFLPLLFLPEGAGEFIRSLPAAILFTVLASLFVALTIIPFLASRMLRDNSPRAAASAGKVARLIGHFDVLADKLLQRVMQIIHNVYGPALRWALARPKTTLLAALGLFLVIAATIPLIGFSLFPSADVPQFVIRVDAPDGASVEETDRALRFVEARLAEHPEVKRWYTHLGHGTPFVYYNYFSQGRTANLGEVFVELRAFDPKRTPKLFEALRARFSDYAAARISLKQFQQGPPVDAPVAIRIVGPEIEGLRRIADQVEQVLKATPGTRDVNNPSRLLRTDLDLGVDTEKAGLLGVSALEVNRTVRLAVAGLAAGQFRASNGDEYDITLRLPMRERPSIEALDAIEVSTSNGRQIPLREISTPHFQSVTNSITRYNRERQVTVSANTRPDFNTARVTAEVVRHLGEIGLPPGYRFVIAGDAEAQQESFSGLLPAILVAVFGILAVLVLEFGSFRSTAIVAGVIPLGLTGALLALLATGYTLSFTSIIGMIALIGIEIKNSILLVDFTNQLRERGTPLDQAIQEAGEVRFLPILLTSATAIGGLTPLAVQGSALYSPLAIVIIGGLISSTLLARLVTPVMYKLLPPSVQSTEYDPRFALT
ncbi:MAG TPA: efflux RND transporter permease subunit [Steroidobacteraceae bacterium]|nr:efflux RND transporter permease subunit [Steroidobacteraceae bacterium]